MKKNIIKIGLMIIGFMIQIQCSINQALAQVSIKPELRPPYAPEFNDKVAVKGTHHYINFILQVFAGGLIYIAGPLAVLMLVWGGSSYITAMGDQGKTDKAKKTIIYAIAGLIVIILSYSLVGNIIAIVGSGVS